MKSTNLKIYYSLIFTNNLWFITSNWLNFWLKYMSLKEVGIIDAVGFLVGILLEFPSGVISDRLGRKQTLLISQSLQMIGSVLITLASNLYEIGAGFILFQIGIAFYSGTIESYGYESSAAANENYDKVLVKSGIYNNFSFLGSLIVGGYLYTQNVNLPNVLFTITFLIGIITCLLIKGSEVINDNQQINTFTPKINYLIIVLFVVILTVSFAFDFGFLKLFILEKFSDLNSNYWYIFVGIIVSLAISSYLLPRINNFIGILWACIVLLAGSFIASLTTYIPLFFILCFMSVFVYQLSLKYINERVGDNSRAGAISLFNLTYKLPYVLIALLLGYNLV